MSISEGEHNFIEGMAAVSSVMNFSDAMGRIYGVLFFNASPLSMDDICEKLSLTKGTVSVYLRELESRNIVRRIWSKKGRKKYYEAEYDPAHLVEHRLKHIGKRNIGDFLKTVEECQTMIKAYQDSMEGEERITAQLLYERLEKIKMLNVAIKKFLTFMSEGVVTAEKLKKIEIG
ncbi:MAG: winged helix-turn-helix transcriptional regulator [Candidatus Eremiobacterota bacterium]